MRSFILLVSLIVLFIDNNQAKIGIGKKQCRTRADNYRRITGSNCGPVARARARRQLRVPFNRPHTEPRREAIQKLSR